MLVTSIFCFSHNVFCQSQKEFLFLSYMYFVVCKCLYLDQSQNLLFGKRLNKEFVDIISCKNMQIRVKRTVCCFNSIFTKRQNFGLDQIGGICRRQNKCESKMEIWYGKGRKQCGKLRKCWSPAFSHFPHNIFKGFFLKIVKRQDMVEKGKTEDIPVCNAFPLLCNCLTGGWKSHREKSHGKKKSWGKIVMEKKVTG